MGPSHSHTLESESPRVTMGMPVFNGERYLEQALHSLLSQTFQDFELIISDNASSDRTPTICRDAAAADSRIQYFRNDRNIGLWRNQNSVIHRARGEYFLLAHHDDLRHATYLERTVSVLDADRSVVVCYTRTQDIDEGGVFVERTDPLLRLDAPNPRTRLRDIIRLDHICEPDFGLTRTAVLRRTPLHGEYADSDRVLLAELILHGPFRRLDEILFYRRAHAGQTTAAAPSRQARTIQYGLPGRSTLVFPHFRQLADYLGAIRRVPLSAQDRWACLTEVVGQIGTNRQRLMTDLGFALRTISRPLYRRLRSRKAKR